MGKFMKKRCRISEVNSTSGFVVGLKTSRMADEKGIALILTLSMLVILSVLGVIVLTSSTTEVGISGNYKSSQQALYAAERTVEYVMASDSILKNDPGEEIDLNTETETDGNTYASKVTVGSTGLLSTGENKVRIIGAGELTPALKAKWGPDWKGYYYGINITGSGPQGKSTNRVNAQMGRVYEASESAFTTTSGG